MADDFNMDLQLDRVVLSKVLLSVLCRGLKDGWEYNDSKLAAVCPRREAHTWVQRLTVVVATHEVPFTLVVGLTVSLSEWARTFSSAAIAVELPQRVIVRLTGTTDAPVKTRSRMEDVEWSRDNLHYLPRASAHRRWVWKSGGRFARHNFVGGSRQRGCNNPAVVVSVQPVQWCLRLAVHREAVEGERPSRVEAVDVALPHTVPPEEFDVAIVALRQEPWFSFVQVMYRVVRLELRAHRDNNKSCDNRSESHFV